MFLGVWPESYLFFQKEVGYAVSFPIPGGQDLEVIGQLMVWDLWSCWSCLPFRAGQLSA